MKKIKRTLIGILVSLAMVLQFNCVCWAQVYGPATNLTSAEQSVRNLFNEKIGSKTRGVNYFEVGVKFKGNPITGAFSQYFEKVGTPSHPANTNEAFELKKTATFRAFGYVVDTGANDQVWIYVESLDEDGWHPTYFQGLESISDVKSENDVKDYFINIVDMQLTLTQEHLNESEIHAKIKTVTSTGEEDLEQSAGEIHFFEGETEKVEFTRTATLVSGEKNVWQVTLVGDCNIAGKNGSFVFEDQLASQFEMVLPKPAGNSSSIANAAGVATTDWNNTNVALCTSGTLIEQTSNSVKWKMNKIDETTPIVISYRVRMISGSLGVDYDILSTHKLDYKLADDSDTTADTKNAAVKAEWAKLNINYRKTSTGEVSSDNADIWYKVPNPYSNGCITFNYYVTKVNNNSPAEYDASGTRTVGELLPPPTAWVGYVVTSASNKNITQVSDSYTIDGDVPTTPVGSVGVTNFIQPEGLCNISFKSTLSTYDSKDIKITVDLDKIVNAAIGTNKVFDCKFNVASKRFVKVSDGSNDYTPSVVVNGNKLELTLPASAPEFAAGTELTTTIYFETGLKSGIHYHNNGTNVGYYETFVCPGGSLTPAELDVDIQVDRKVKIALPTTPITYTWTNGSSAPSTIQVACCDLSQIH